jgi:hypothetical protein
MDKSKVYVQMPAEENRQTDDMERENERKTVSEVNREQQSVTPGMNKPFSSVPKTGSEITDGEDA